MSNRRETKSTDTKTNNIGSERHQQVVGFFKSVWQHHDLSVKEQSAPNPSEHAKTQTREEAMEWHKSLRGSPLLHSRRFFLVEYGIELLEGERIKREMHVSLLAYTSFVLIFLIYVFTNVPVANTYATQTAIHDAVVDRPWIVSNPGNSSKDTSNDVLHNTLRHVESPYDVWEWLLYGLTNVDSSNTGPFSSTKRIADWNVVIGAVRLRQIRLNNNNCEIGKTKITAQLDVFQGTDCHGVATLAGIATEPYGPGTAKTLTSAPMLERTSAGLYTYQTASELAHVIDKNGNKINILQPSAMGITGNYGVYDYGGYVVDLPSGDATNAHSIVQQLKLDHWLDSATAGLIVSFTTYNPNLNMFTYNRILLEYTGTGLVKLTVLYRPFQMPALFYEFQKSDGRSQVFITYLFMINVFGWLSKLLWRGCKSCTSPDPSNKFDIWGWIDLFNLILLSIQLGERIVWELTFNEINQFANYAGGTNYYDFEQLSWWFEFERILAYINTLTVFLKYMKLMRLSPRLSLLVKVVYAAGQYVVSWFVVAISLLIGYIFMGYILFGAQLHSFSTLSRTTITLFNYIVGQFNNADENMELYEGSGFESLEYAGLNQDVLFFASPTFFFLTFNLIFYLFLMRVMVAIFVTAYTEVSREIERSERKNNELNRTHKETLKHLPDSFGTSTCGWFLNAYVFSGIISIFPEPPSEKHILHSLKAEPELIKKGYLNYQELEQIVRQSLANNPTKCCGYICGKRMNSKDVDDAMVESLCVRLLCIQQINMHRVPQIMALFQDITDGNRAGGINSRNIEMQEMNNETKRGGNIGNDGLEEKAEKANNQNGPEMTDLQTEMEWNVDIMSGDALHSALYVYKKHFEEGHEHFVNNMKEQDSALRSLFNQILDIERQVNETYEYFSGEPIQHLPYSTEEGKLHYEELQKIQQEILDKDRKQNAIDGDEDDDDDDDSQNTSISNNEDSDDDTEDDTDEEDEE